MTTNNRHWWVRLIVYLTFWTTAYFVLIGVFASSAAGSLLIDHLYTSIFIFTLLIPVSVNDLVLQPQFLSKRKYAAYFALAAVNILVGAALNHLLFSRAIDYILPGYYFISYYVFGDLLNFFVTFVVLNTLLALSLEWFRLQEQRYRANLLEKERVSAEFKALAAQVNPHFLFNSLTILYALSLKNSNDTSGAILKLSEILRYVIYQSSAQTVSLSAELRMLKDFIDLQRYRVHPSTKIDFSESIAQDNVQVAPMLFLPLLENSFKHGIQNETTDAFVQAKASEAEGLVHFTIINNKAAHPQPGMDGGFGLKNLQERLRLIYPGKHHLRISETESTFAVSLQIDTK